MKFEDIRQFLTEEHLNAELSPSEWTIPDDLLADIPDGLLRLNRPVASLWVQAVRHYTNLSKKNFSIDSQFYPPVLA